MEQYTRRAALGLIAGGSVLVAANTNAFSRVSGGRTVATDVADDANALLGLDGFDESALYEEPNRVTVTNQTGGPLTGANEVTSANGRLVFDDPDTSTKENQQTLSLSDLADGESEAFDIVTAAGESGEVTDEVTVYFEEPGEVEIAVTRSLTVESNPAASIVYVKNDELFLYDVLEDVEKNPPDNGQVDVIGGQAVDIKGDDDADLPYVYQNGMRATEEGGPDVELLATNQLERRKTRLAVGEWPTDTLSNPLVFYANNNDKELRATDGSGDQEVIARPGDGVRAVAGPADVDDDGQDELVYLDGSENLQYIEQDGTNEDIGVGVGANNSAGVGPPADFTGSGTPRIPIVDGSNQPALVADDGTKEVLAGGIAKKSAVSPGDPDLDEEFELLFLNSDTGEINYVDDVGGSNDVKVLEVEGAAVAPSEQAGLNSATDFVG